MNFSVHVYIKFKYFILYSSHYFETYSGQIKQRNFFLIKWQLNWFMLDLVPTKNFANNMQLSGLSNDWIKRWVMTTVFLTIHSRSSVPCNNMANKIKNKYLIFKILRNLSINLINSKYLELIYLFIYIQCD